MSKHKARRIVGVIILGYIIALFCMLPTDFELVVQAQTKNYAWNRDLEAPNVIAGFAESTEEVQIIKDLIEEEEIEKVITTQADPVFSEEPQIEDQEQTGKENTEVLPVSTIESRLPGVVYLHIDYASPESPIILSEERISDIDVEVDISTATDSSLEYTVSEALEICISKIVFREAGTQPFLGKVLVAEGLVNRLRSGVYGTDVLAILQQGGYGAEMDEDGNFHIYRSDGREVFDVPEADIAAAKIALNGSVISNTVLEAATQMRNNQYNIALGEECYRYGCIYHYNPDLVTDKALNARTINRVPVSFRYVEHVFYGYWLNAKNAMNII